MEDKDLQWKHYHHRMTFMNTFPSRPRPWCLYCATYRGKLIDEDCGIGIVWIEERSACVVAEAVFDSF